MKTIPEIYARAVILLCLFDRGGLEYPILDGVKHSKAERVKQQKIIVDWMNSWELPRMMTNAEKKLMCSKIGELQSEDIVYSDFVFEAIEPCLWALSLVDELTDYWNISTDYHTVLIEEIEETFKKCKLRDVISINRQRDVARLWNWRWQQFMNQTAEPLKDGSVEELVLSQFGEAYRPVVSEIFGDRKDFALLNEHHHDEVFRSRACRAEWRYLVFEWILSDKAWDTIAGSFSKQQPMRGALEIYARAVLLLCLYDRGDLEYPVLDGMIQPKGKRLKQRNLMLKWMESMALSQTMTIDEWKFMHSEIGEANDENIVYSDYVYEAIEPLLWSLSLVDELSDYNWTVATDFHPLLIGATEETFAKCKLRDSLSIFEHRNVAVLWHWRWQMERSNPMDEPLKEGAMEELVVSEFGELFRPLVAGIIGNRNDFVLYDQPYPSGGLDREEITRIRANLAKWRYHAFEWILSNKAWSEIDYVC